MDPQLPILLEIQEISSKVRELRAGTALSELEAKYFGMDPLAAADELEGQVAALEDRLDPAIRGGYDRIAGRVDRFVVPVISGTCFGCFVSIPTLTAGGTDPNAELHRCEHCGRFLYILS